MLRSRKKIKSRSQENMTKLYYGLLICLNCSEISLNVPWIHLYVIFDVVNVPITETHVNLRYKGSLCGFLSETYKFC